MSFRFSTKLRNEILSGAPVLRPSVQISASTIAAVDGGAGADSFTDSANGFLAAGFTPGDSFLSSGWTTTAAANNLKIFTVINVVAGTITLVPGVVAAKIAGDPVVFTLISTATLRDIFKDGVLKIYSGVQPLSADAAITGTLLATISVGSGTFVPGAPGNGLELGIAAAGVIAKDSSAWSGVAVADGIAGWYRFYANATDVGALDSGYVYPRMDGSIGTSGAQLIASSTSIKIGATITLDSYQISLAAEGA